MRTLLLTLLMTAVIPRAEARRPVNTWIGTGGWPHTSGMTFPGATTPFGLVRLSPDTRPSFPLDRLAVSGYSTAGYGYRDRRLWGFSHTRLSGTGVRDGGAFRVLPVTRDHARNQKLPLGIAFQHADEQAEPGYYSVRLRGEQVTAELTASAHCGFHRYRRGATARAITLRFDVTSGLQFKTPADQGRFEISGDGRVLRGSARSLGEFASRQGGLPTWFYAELSQPAARLAGAAVRTGDALLEELRFAAETGEIELRLCVSHVSAENAKLNFDAEARGVSFESARALAQSRWDEYFARAEIETRDRDTETMFYSFLYFSSVMPTQFSDVNGEYVGFDRKTHVARGFTYRTDLSLWDTFRTAHPLYSLIAPEIQRDSAHSLMAMASQGRGVLPRWAFGAGDSGSMFGSPANFVLAEAWLKGIRDFDAAEALSFMTRGATADDYTREPACRAHGYCPSDRVKKSVSKTLEYAWSDFAAAELARASGNAAAEREFRARSGAFRELWDPSTRFFRPRDSQGRFTRFQPRLTSYFEFLYRPANQYAEGGPHHYRYSAPHRARELISLFGGPSVFVRELDAFLMGASKRRSALNPGAYYWHGNEHDLHAIYLFNEAGRPDLTQEWARWALDDRYAATPDGLDGNDDGGTLSAWYVLSSLGLYPQAGTDRYWLGSPAVNRARLRLGPAHGLEIVAHAQSKRNVYVSRVLVNGRRWCEPSITHAELLDARLEFEMSRKPARTFDCAAP